VREALAQRIVRDRSRLAAISQARAGDADRGPSGRRRRRRSVPQSARSARPRRQRAAKVNVYDGDARKRLFDKINRVAANLDLDTAVDGAGGSKDSHGVDGNAEKKEKMASGVRVSH
jgi:hypothetical protein